MSAPGEHANLVRVPEDHVVQLYDELQSLIAVVSTYLRDAWKRGDHLLVVARPYHWSLVSAELSASGCPVSELVAEGKFVALDAATTLGAIEADGHLQRAQFESRTFPLLERLTGTPGTGLTAYGEMVDVLASQGNFAAAEELELFWNQALTRFRFRMMCSYASASFGDARHAGHLHAICRAHGDALARPADLLATWLLSNRRSKYHLGAH